MVLKTRSYLNFCFIAATTIYSSDALADEPSVQDEIKALKARISALESNLQRVANEPVQPPLGVRFDAGPGRGITLSTTDNRFSITVRGRVQIRDTFAHAEGKTTNEINVKTMRLYVHGHVMNPNLRYWVQLAFGGGDFEPGNLSPIFDAFVESSHLRDLNVRVGQFFVPFDRARTIREFALQFVDRQSVVRELSLDRDVGVMLHSNDLGGLRGKLGYAIFVGSGDGRNRFGGQALGPLAVGRLVVKPFGWFDDDHEADVHRERRVRMAIGLAGAYNHATTRANSTYGGTFTAGTANYAHAAADLVFKWRGVSLLAEGLLRKATRDAIDGVVDGAPKREWTRSGYGYFLQAGVMFHDKAEAVARWEQLFAWKGTDPAFVTAVEQQGKQVGGGVNVYVNGHLLKVQSDYFYIFGKSGVDPRHAVRLQLDASF